MTPLCLQSRDLQALGFALAPRMDADLFTVPGMYMTTQYLSAVSVVITFVDTFLGIVAGPGSSVQSVFYPQGAPEIVVLILQYLLAVFFDFSETVSRFSSPLLSVP